MKTEAQLIKKGFVKLKPYIMEVMHQSGYSTYEEARKGFDRIIAMGLMKLETVNGVEYFKPTEV